MAPATQGQPWGGGGAGCHEGVGLLKLMLVAMMVALMLVFVLLIVQPFDHTGAGVAGGSNVIRCSDGSAGTGHLLRAPVAVVVHGRAALHRRRLRVAPAHRAVGPRHVPPAHAASALLRVLVEDCRRLRFGFAGFLPRFDGFAWLTGPAWFLVRLGSRGLGSRGLLLGGSSGGVHGEEEHREEEEQEEQAWGSHGGRGGSGRGTT